jgi:hypothetical protein
LRILLCCPCASGQRCLDPCPGDPLAGADLAAHRVGGSGQVFGPAVLGDDHDRCVSGSESERDQREIVMAEQDARQGAHVADRGQSVDRFDLQHVGRAVFPNADDDEVEDPDRL